MVVGFGGEGRACDTFERDRGNAAGQQVYEKADNELRGSRGRLSECAGLITRASRSPNYVAFQIVLKDSVVATWGWEDRGGCIRREAGMKNISCCLLDPAWKFCRGLAEGSSTTFKRNHRL